MLVQKIDEDLKEALKAKDTLKLETLRMLKASLRNFLIEKRKETAEDSELMSLIQKQIKLRQDSIESFQKGGRKDLVDKENKEKQILESYLPAAMSDQEIEKMVKAVIQETGSKSKADLGKVMKEAISRSQGRADGKKISQFAAHFLVIP